jgi:CheY-like chemotaxis protein
MANRLAPPKRILLVEDEYLIAQDMACELLSLGAEVVGPVPTVEQALRLIEEEPGLDAAFLDVNLAGDHAYPVVEALRERGTPIVFTTGYDADAIPARYADIPRCAKPVTRTMLERILSTVAG